MSATSEWADRVRSWRGSVRSIIGDVAALSLHAQANSLDKALAEPTPELNGLSLEDALQLKAVFGAFEAWLQAPATADEGAPTRINVLFKSS